MYVHNPAHPGELLTGWLDDLGVSVTAFAAHIGTVTRQGASFLVTTESLKIGAMQEADTYCTGKGKKYKFMYNKDIPAGALGRWPESEVLFKCE